MRECSALQNADRVICVEERVVGAVRNNIVKAATRDLGGLFCSRLDGVVLGEICIKDVNVRALAQLFGNFLLGGLLSANDTNDQVVGIGRYLL